METVRKINFFKEYILPALAVLLACTSLVLKGFPVEKTTLIGFALIYVVLMNLGSPLYYALCKFWNPVSPINKESALETTALHLVSYGLVIIPSLAFFTRGNGMMTLHSIGLILTLLAPLSFAWMVMNKYVTGMSKMLKSADYKPWSP